MGLVVAVLWIAPEYSTFYLKYCTYGAGATTTTSPYEPAVCGWGLTYAKLFASAFVIAPIEEVFFRSFLYRRIQAVDFTKVPHNRFDLSAFLWMVLIFSLEHNRILAAAMAAAVYGWLYLRWGLGAAVTAHVVTNFALGAYVIVFNQWGFW